MYDETIKTCLFASFFETSSHDAEQPWGNARLWMVTGFTCPPVIQPSLPPPNSEKWQFFFFQTTCEGLKKKPHTHVKVSLNKTWYRRHRASDFSPRRREWDFRRSTISGATDSLHGCAPTLESPDAQRRILRTKKKKRKEKKERKKKKPSRAAESAQRAGLPSDRPQSSSPGSGLAWAMLHRPPSR